MSQLDEKLIILDGVPRTRSQVGRLDQVLSARGCKVDLALYLRAPVEELVARFRKRWSCEKCGAVYSFSEPPSLERPCDKCKSVGSFARRRDDEEDAVRHRFSVFHGETAPLLLDYADRGFLREVDGLKSGEEVYRSLETEIGREL